jgi:hypothetical protein
MRTLSICVGSANPLGAHDEQTHAPSATTTARSLKPEA